MATQQSGKGTRIYSSQAPETTYTGAAQSIGFKPVTARNSEKADRERKQALIQDQQTASRELQRSQNMQNIELEAQQRADMGKTKLDDAVEAAELKRQQQWEADSLRLEQEHEKGLMSLESTKLQLDGQIASTRLSLAGTAIDGLLSLSSSYLQYKEEVKAQEAEEAAVSAILGAGSVLDSGAAAAATDRAVRTANQDAALQVAPNEPSTRAAITEGTSNAAASNNIGGINAQQAIMLLPAQIADFSARDAEVQLPDGRVLRPSTATSATDIALIQNAYAAQALRDAGFGQLPTSEVAAVAGQIRGTISSASAQAVSGFNRRREEEKKATAISLAETQYANGVSSGDNYRRLANELYLTGAYTSRTQANDAAIKELIRIYETNEDIDGLEALLDEPKFVTEDGRRAPSVGSTYGLDIKNAIERIEDREYDQFTDARRDRTRSVYDLEEARYRDLAAAGSDPAKVEEIERRYAQEALAIGGREGQALYDSIASGGFSDSKHAFNQILDDINSGNAPSDSQLRDYRDQGLISSQQYATLAGANTRSETRRTEELKPYASEIKQVADSVIGSARATLGLNSSEFSDEWKAQSAGMRADMNERISRDVHDFILENGDTATPGRVREFVQQRANYYGGLIRSQAEQAATTGADFEYTYLGATSVNDLKAQQYTDARTGRTVRVFTSLPASSFESFSNTDNDRTNDLNPVNDRILSQAEFDASVNALSQANPDAIPPRVVAIAEHLGMSPRVLVEQQGIQNGIDVKSIVNPAAQQATEAVDSTEGGPNSLKSGQRYLESMGFSRRGAAYISGNIQSESSWNGMRSWGQVAGDGTSRNGGLISWASWVNSPARLGAAEAWLGKPIERATHAEQLAFMDFEMRTRYPESYRIFRDPRATRAQLRRASKLYWGYGIEGERYAYAESLL